MNPNKIYCEFVRFFAMSLLKIQKEISSAFPIACISWTNTNTTNNISVLHQNNRKFRSLTTSFLLKQIHVMLFGVISRITFVMHCIALGSRVRCEGSKLIKLIISKAGCRNRTYSGTRHIITVCYTYLNLQLVCLIYPTHLCNIAKFHLLLGN
jgi:hypothetical protein